jgi:hypothetical protein
MFPLQSGSDVAPSAHQKGMIAAVSGVSRKLT